MWCRRRLQRQGKGSSTHDVPKDCLFFLIMILERKALGRFDLLSAAPTALVFGADRRIKYVTTKRKSIAPLLCASIFEACMHTLYIYTIFCFVASRAILIAGLRARESRSDKKSVSPCRYMIAHGVLSFGCSINSL